MNIDDIGKYLAGGLGVDEAPIRHPVMQVKVIIASKPKPFEEAINEFLEKENDNIIDIKYQVCDKWLSAMITYVK